jgi:hypothetical protein
MQTINKHKIIDYLYNAVDLSKFRYNLLNSINRLEYLRDNHHYISPNYKGLNYLLILVNIDDKNISCLIDRKKLSYHKSQLNMITFVINNITLSCDDILYKGTIFDGKLIQNNSENIFLIQDCFYCMGKSMLDMDMILKLDEVNTIINSHIDKTKYNKFKLKINTLYNYDNLENIINNLESCNLPTNGLIFYPQVSGINILYLEKKVNDKIIISENVINSQSYDLINDYVNFLQTRRYSYENNDKNQLFWLNRTPIPDVYDLSSLENSNKIGIALIPNLKISYMCDNLIGDKPVQFNCIFSAKFKKWIPISPSEK